jgi:hypothetical protein
MLATSYLLSSQSSYLEDGFLDHILSLRGCSLLSKLIINEGLDGPFVVQAELQTIVMGMLFRDFIAMDQELACEALLSLRGFAHVLAKPNAQTIEKALVAQMVETIRCLLHDNAVSECEAAGTPDPIETTTILQEFPPSTKTTPFAFLALQSKLFPAGLDVGFYNIDWANITTPPLRTPNRLKSFKALMSTLIILATCDQEALLSVFNPTNQVGNIVMAHFCTIRFVFSPLSAPKNAMRTPAKAVIDWTAKIIAAIEDDPDKEWAKYVEWPKKILRSMQACVKKNRGLTIGDVRDMLLHDPVAFKEGRAPGY